MRKGIVSVFTLFLFMLVGSLSVDAAAFKDVKKSDYYYEAVEWGYKEGIISGNGNGNFNPNDEVTKAAFYKMYAEFYRFNKANVGSGEWYDVYYKTLANYGMHVDKRIANEAIYRGEVAALVAFSQNAYKSHNQPFYDYVDIWWDSLKLSKYMFDKGLSNGLTTANVPLDVKYGFNQTLKRSDAIQFLYNLKQKKFDTLRVKEVGASQTKGASIAAAYPLAGDVVYYERGSNFKNYTGIFVYDGYQIGGYESAVGKMFAGIQIGVPLSNDALIQAEKQASSNPNYSIRLLVDEHRNHTIHAVLWHLKDKSYAHAVNQMLALTPENYDALQHMYVGLVNEFRGKFGQAPIAGHTVLQQAAHLHSVDMATNQFFAHVNLKGESPGDRIRKVSPVQLMSWSENIAMGQSDVFDVHIGWINSLGHRQNMLGAHRYVGFGVYFNPNVPYGGNYYTTKFGSF